MSIHQSKEVPVADLANAPIAGSIGVEIETRLRELQFPYPSSENHVFVFETFVSGAAHGRKMDDVVVHLKADPQSANPPADIIDPETMEVLVEAGSVSPAIPSIEELRQTELPEGPVSISTFGELFDVARRQIYLAAIALNQEWQDGVEA